jgi:hypothetical protein
MIFNDIPDGITLIRVLNKFENCRCLDCTKQDWRRVEQIHTSSAARPPSVAYDFCRMNLEVAFPLFIFHKNTLKM